MWIEASEEVRLAHQALLQAAEAGTVTVRFVGVASRGPIYQVSSLGNHARFGLETLRRAALMSNIRFMLDR
jgi:hypothetical protein